MQLREYLLATMQDSETLDARHIRFGKQVGVSLHCVRKWVNRQRRISDSMKIKIEKVTQKQVTIEEMVRG